MESRRRGLYRRGWVRRQRADRHARLQPGGFNRVHTTFQSLAKLPSINAFPDRRLQARARNRRTGAPGAEGISGSGDRSPTAGRDRSAIRGRSRMTSDVRAADAQARRLARQRANRSSWCSMFTSEAMTRGVRVQIRREYSPERSAAIEQQVVLPLHGHDRRTKAPKRSSLLTRHWVITDGTGHIDEVRGPGVVGKQPTLAPGESFEYTSGWPLRHAVRRDGRHLPDGHGARRTLRREDRAVHAERALHGALTGCCRTPVWTGSWLYTNVQSIARLSSRSCR